MSRNFELIKQLEEEEERNGNRPAMAESISRPEPVNRPDPMSRPEPVSRQEPVSRPEPAGRQDSISRQYSLDDAGVQFGDEIVLLVHTVFLAHAPARRAVVFCGVDSESGSSVVCASAGRALAAISGKSVCLVDGNLRDARLSKTLGIHRERRPLDRSSTLYDRCASIEGNLSCAGSDLLTDAYGGLLPTPELKQRIEWLEGAFDFLLIDTPGVAVAKDAAILGEAAGAAILVVEANKTHRQAARKAKQSLEAAGVRITGTVLRNHAEPIPENLLKRL